MAKIKNKADGSSWYIQPLQHSKPEISIVYNANDEKLRAGKTINCNTEDEIENQIKNNIKLDKNAGAQIETAFGDCQLRIYRLAVATTGEYTTWAGGQAAALATLTNSANIISEMYERELTIRFSLITNNNIIFPNETTDPYDSGVGITSNILTQNNTTLNNPTYLGSDFYDVGVLFGYGTGWSGGLAQVSSVCGGNKGKSAGGLNSSCSSGSSGPVFDGTMAHEIGHQFSARHTMSANTGGCGSNLNATTMWEAGGGSTIMAYAGTCNPLQFQWNSDDYFHAGSINQIITFLNTAANNCAQVISSNNSSPVTSTLGNSFAIPHSTPFKLQINANDNNNSLTYTFDQLDLAPNGGVNYAPQDTSTVGPLFRSRYPTTQNFRHFPSLAIQSGQESGTFEVIPSVARTITIRGVVRDNNDEAGCVAYESFGINVQSCGPFIFTNLQNDTALVANGTNALTLTWNTASSCVTTANVCIKFSDDGGKTYPYTIVASTPNDGTESIIIPNLPTCNGSFMIEAVGNIYYTINEGNVSITNNTCLVNGASIFPDTVVVAEIGSQDLNMNIQPIVSDSTVTSLVGTLTNAVAPSSLAVLNLATNSCINYSNTAYYQVFEVYPTATATATFTFIKPAASGSVISVYDGTYYTNNPCAGFLNSASTVANASSPTSIGSTVSQLLCKDQKYTIVVSTFSNSYPTLPHSFTVNITSNVTGAELKWNASGLPTGTQYGYVIYNTSTNNIVAITSSTNMSNSNLFPIGNYAIYGISTTSSIATLNSTYANTNFQNFLTAVYNQSNGLCADLSSNVAPIFIVQPLPTELLSFTGTIVANNAALLNWKVQEDEDIQHYELERDTEMGFKKIAQIPANINSGGNALQQYHYIDKSFSKFANPSAYYRLKLVDKNNNYNYSNVIPLTINKANVAVSINPNPIENDIISVAINNGQNTNFNYELIDILGKVQLKSSINVESGNKQFNIPAHNLAPGVYFLHIESNNYNETIKQVKP